jgi:hypothetical protein
MTPLMFGDPITAYVGQTRSKALIRQLESACIGECVTRGQLPPRRNPWFYDNGAYVDFQAGSEFGANQFMRDLRAIRSWTDSKMMVEPDFIVIPDKVAAGAASLQFSLEWMEVCKGAEAPLYLAVQDEMNGDEAMDVVRRYRLQGLFVGGTLDWKISTAPYWLNLAREAGVKLHIGRVGTADRVKWARMIGADSIDSSLPLWSEANMARFLGALR